MINCKGYKRTDITKKVRQPLVAKNKKSKLVGPQQLRGVDVYAVVTNGNPTTNQEITRDINNLASAIWEQCGITFFLRRISRVTTTVIDKEFESSLSFSSQPAKIRGLFNFRPPGSTRQDIMVIYVPGTTFKNNRTNGVTFRFSGQSGPRIATVFIASQARLRYQVLAHEFGHALLYDPVTDTNTDPTPGVSGGHVPASNRNNLMLPSVPISPTINAGQCRAAARSPLITSLIQASNRRRNRPKKRI
jgi:hypothetical protein